jgi:hypothetical protein
LAKLDERQACPVDKMHGGATVQGWDLHFPPSSSREFQATSPLISEAETVNFPPSHPQAISPLPFPGKHEHTGSHSHTPSPSPSVYLSLLVSLLSSYATPCSMQHERHQAFCPLWGRHTRARH